MIIRCLELPDDDLDRGPILDSLAENPQVKGLIMTMGMSPDGLKNILEVLQHVHIRWKFETYCMGVMRGAFQEYGELPKIQCLMEDLEARLNVDLGPGPSEETERCGTPGQLRSLKLTHQLIQRGNIRSRADFVAAIGSETKADNHIKAVKRLCVRILQEQFDTIGESRPDHYREWSGGIQRMVLDLWNGSVTVDP
jgi:hypothetical protein